MAVIDNHLLVLPVDQDPRHGWEAQFSTYKQGLLQQMLTSITSLDYLEQMPNVKLLLQADGKIAWLANFSSDSYQEINWHIGKKLLHNQATLIRKNGSTVTRKQINLQQTGSSVTINEELKPFELIQLIFSK